MSKYLNEAFPDQAIQQEVIIGDFYKVDYFLPEQNLVVEVMGHYHTNGEGKARRRDVTRKLILKKLGYKYCEMLTKEFLPKLDLSVKHEYFQNQIRIALNSWQQLFKLSVN